MSQNCWALNIFPHRHLFLLPMFSRYIFGLPWAVSSCWSEWQKTGHVTNSQPIRSRKQIKSQKTLPMKLTTATEQLGYIIHIFIVFQYTQQSYVLFAYFSGCIFLFMRFLNGDFRSFVITCTLLWQNENVSSTSVIDLIFQ